MFCRDVVHVDLEHLRRTPATNAFIGQHSSQVDVKEPSPIQDVFARVMSGR
jgi:hypothetical protein